MNWEGNKEGLKSLRNEEARNVINKNKIKTGLTCFYTNMGSVFSYNKRDELYMHKLEHKYDIVGLSETWANDNTSHSELNIPGYRVYRKDRNNIFKSKGGGVAMYINKKLVSRHHEILPDTECEAVWAKISLSKNSHLIVEVCYRSPSYTTEENMQLTKVIETAANNCALLFGDSNYRSIDLR